MCDLARQIFSFLVPLALVICQSAWAQESPAPASSKSAKSSAVVRRPDRLLQAGHTGLITALAVSSDGRRLASGGYDKTVIIWNTATGDEQGRLTGQGAPITHLAFSPDGTHLASSSSNGVVKIWDYQKASPVYSLKLRASPAVVSYSADGKFWITVVGPAKEGGNPSIEIHDAATGRVVRAIPTPESYPFALTITPDGLLIGATPADNESDGAVRVWKFTTGELLKSYQVGADAISSDGRLMAR